MFKIGHTIKLKSDIDLNELKKYNFKFKYNEDTGEINRIYYSGMGILTFDKKGSEYVLITNTGYYGNYSTCIRFDILLKLEKASLLEKLD